ncbi:MAG: hypothetical protein WAX07_02045 [Candidatus Altiarchaeia archaeon]
MCDSGENRCNCPEDCSGTSTTTLTNQNCAKEGETAGHFNNDLPQCCSGLSKIVDEPRPDGRGGCSLTPAGFMICVNCGDGICGKGENRCNCPQDCSNTESECVEEGERLGGLGEDKSKECCPGLIKVFDQWEPDRSGKCLALDNYGYYCLKCGDGICGKGENKCNCPPDCKDSAGQECVDSFDCVVAVNLGACCACPTVLPKSRLDGIIVVYESGKDYSSSLPAECKNAVCSPCGPVSGAICKDGKCVNAPVCGNIYCEQGEDGKNCPQDCGNGADCGNGFCEVGESQASCARDCIEKRIVCGDNFCATGENELNCPVDCGLHRSVCGNGFCEKPVGENATNCAIDCEINSVCGNLACEEDEDRITCPQDCADRT